MTSTSITTWEAFADATLDHDPRARQMGRELARQAPRHARIRKPNRRRGSIARYAVTGTLVFLAAFFLGTVFPQLAHASTVTGSLAADNAACSAVYHYHHVDVTDYTDAAAWHHAFHHAWHEAMGADPEMRRDIHRYLWTDRGWWRVSGDCNPDSPADQP